MRSTTAALMGTQRLLREALAAARSPATVPAPPGAGRSVVEVWLCDTPVLIETEAFGVGGPTFVNLHENEHTSVAAARAVLATSPGRLVRLCSRGRRNIVFWNGIRPHAFDPNRIFTDAGLRQTLSRHASLTDAAFDAVLRLRVALLAGLNGDAPVVALHNNAGGDYTIGEYGAGRHHAGDAAAVSMNARWPTEDFFVVTHAHWFEHLRDRGFNVVLQSPGAADDGSLSVWFQRSGRVYVNVEARHGRLAAQEQMLRALTDAAAA